MSTILLGKAEEHDLVMPRVREVVAQPGIWIGGDSEHPEFTVPLSVRDGVIFSMCEDEPLDPSRFRPSVTFHGPYLVDTNFVAVLAELVRLKDLKDAADAEESVEIKCALLDDFEEAEPAAWAAARALIPAKG